MSGVEGKWRPSPLSLFTYMTCVAWQRGTFNNVIGKIGKIKTEGEYKLWDAYLIIYII